MLPRIGCKAAAEFEFQEPTSSWNLHLKLVILKIVTIITTIILITLILIVVLIK